MVVKFDSKIIVSIEDASQFFDNSTNSIIYRYIQKRNHIFELFKLIADKLDKELDKYLKIISESVTGSFNSLNNFKV